MSDGASMEDWQMRRTVLALLTATMLAVTAAGGTALAAIESGTNRADNLVGTGDHDNLKGWGGDDTIKGRGALDRLYGMNEADTVRGGGGPDYVYGGDGRDVILGGPGGDHLRGGKSDNGDADDPYGSGEEITAARVTTRSSAPATSSATGATTP